MYHIMTTAEAVTPVPGLSVTFFVLLGLYGTLGVLSFFILSKIYRHEMGRLNHEPEGSQRARPDSALWGNA